MFSLQRRRQFILQAKKRSFQKNKQKSKNFNATNKALTRAISMQKNTTGGKGGCNCGK